MSRTEARRRGGRSVAVSIVLLVVAALAAATLVLFGVTFSGPPPRPAPLPYAQIAAALKTGIAPPGREVRVVEQPAPPTPRGWDRPAPGAARRIAALLGARPADVVALMADPGNERSEEVRGPFQIGWRRGAAWRIAETAGEPFITRWHRVTLAAMLIVLTLLSALAWLVARAISRPLRQVADAALSARAGAPLGSLPSGGATEVRDLAQAVATMHDRLQRHAESRNTMLGAIAHDLGTPLSRLAFWVEQLPDRARDRAVADIDEMRAMIAATLALARDEASGSEPARLDLGSLLDSLVEDMRVAGTPVALTPGPRAIVRGDSGALRRVFQNLIDNAVRYGEAAEIGWTVAGNGVRVTVADRGPGLGDADPERLFEPFVRRDPSRNRATGGTGLGLAIVRALVERHGGTARLESRAEGGARATVVLPRA